MTARTRLVWGALVFVSAVVVSGSAGMPIWSSMLLAEQASAQFAAEFRLANWTRWPPSSRP